MQTDLPPNPSGTPNPGTVPPGQQYGTPPPGGVPPGYPPPGYVPPGYPPPGYPPPGYPPPGYAPPGYPPVYIVAPPQNSTNAILALVFGISGFIGLAFIGGILAIIFGNNAQREIVASGGRLGGSDMARIGIILGWVSIGLSVAAILFVLIFFLFTSLAIFSASQHVSSFIPWGVLR